MACDVSSRLMCGLVYVAFMSCVMSARFSDASCKFPDFYKSSDNSTDRDWKGRIKNQNTEVTFQISISENIIRATSTDDSATSYTRVCVRAYGDKYVVAHEQQGQEGARFTCIQFVKRGDHVFQFREAPVGTSMNKNICNNNNLELNPWLIIDMNHVADDVRAFPFNGGFSVHIYDRKHGRGICASYQGMTRIESECVEGEGLYFRYRYYRCIPDHIYMYVEQRTLCLSHWQEGPYTFVLLRHDDRKQYMWLLRYPTGLGDSLAMILFNDLVADMNSHAGQTLNYLRLDAIRDTPRPATALCLDDYEECSYKRDPCDDAIMTMYCPRTCGVCHATRPRGCTFESQYQGQWYDAVEPGSLALTVNSTSLTTYDKNIREQLHCIEWDPESEQNAKPFAKTRMLVREFNNGCRPRFSCVQFMQHGRSALFFKLSQGLAWPFTSSRREPLDCSKFAYEEVQGLNPNKFRSRNLNLVYIRASNTVSCDLPRTEGEYVATFRDGNQCASSILQNQSANSFTLDLMNCSGSELGGTYVCADSSRMFPRRDQILITRSGSNPDLIYCWMLPRRQHDVFYLIKAANCNEALRKKLSRGRLKPLITFTRNGIIPELDYEDREPNELPTIVVDPTLNQPHPTHSSDQKYSTPFYRVEGADSNWNSSHPRGNTTDTDSDMEITVKSVAVVSVVLVMAVLQTLCVCNC